MSRFLEYFNNIDKDAEARAAHYASPEESMTAFGLSAAEQRAILFGSREDHAKAVGVDAIDFSTLHTPLTIFPPSQFVPGAGAKS